MKKITSVLAIVAAVGLAANGAWAATVVVNSFAANTSTPGVWGVTDVSGGGSASIVTAPSGDPLGPGAAQLTTDSTNTAKAEVGIANNFGTASSIISTINLDYSFYKAATAGAPAPAPAIKLTFYNAAYAAGGNDGFVTLVYEPYYQIAGNPATDTWLSSGTIDATHGEFWENGGFGQSNQAGGSYAGNNTLAGWQTTFDATSGNAFDASTLIGIQIGMGTFNPTQIGYFDDVVINGTAQKDTTYNFEVAPVPLPSAAGMGLGLLAVIGAAGLLRKRRFAV